MAHNSSMKQIDGERLKKALLRRDLKVAETGLALGRSRGFLSNSVKNGWIHKATIQILDERYGIKLAEYEIPEEPKEDPAKDTKSEDALEDIITAAVLKALEEFSENHGPEAIVKAMEKWRKEG